MSTSFFPVPDCMAPKFPVGDAFTFSMKSGLRLDGSGTMAAASIYQVGEVPSTAKSIRFQVSLGFQTSVGDLHVTLDNTLLPLIESDAMGH